jgi:flagellar L-ring protein precursor FlgH
MKTPRPAQTGLILLAIPMLLLLSTAAIVCRADGASLFASLYGDRVARGIGDTLHLVIVEATSANMKTDQTAQQKTTSDIAGGTGKLSFLKALGFSGSTASSASGSSARGGTMSARMTVRIVEVTDAGNLVIEGQRSVVVNNDKETITIRGEVRGKDVRPDNTIYSYDLANVQITYVGSDPRKPARKVGLITRLINLVF